MWGRVALFFSLLTSLTSAGSSPSVSNSDLKLSFSQSTADFAVEELSQSGVNLLIAPGTGDIWTTLVAASTGTGFSASPSLSACTTSFSNPSPSSLTLTWANCSCPSVPAARFDVHIEISLLESSSSTVTSWNTTFVRTGAEKEWSLWQATVSVPGLTTAEDDMLFYPKGYGVSMSASSVSSLRATYPGSLAMQFMSIGGGSAVKGLSAYVASHDPTASMKDLFVEISAGRGALREGAKNQPLCVDELPRVHSKTFPLPLSSMACSARPSTSTATTASARLGVSQVFHLAGQPWDSFSVVPFVVAVGSQPVASAPAWFGPAMIYRSWVLSSAPWTAKGLVSQRTDFPSWFLQNNLWVNSGWQCHDVFNDTQGAPAEVARVVPLIRKRFAQDLALHWYEFQQGPDPDPSARYKFDTHYPDYFPARPNFTAVVAALAADGVSTFPYINGRIFDINSVSYKTENGELYVTKRSDPVFESPDIVPYEESYGSGATFNVADPSSPYWNKKIADVVAELVTMGNAGVYIDQIGAASPTSDWTPAHGHFGGGSWWVEGQHNMMDLVRSHTPAPIVTESNAESYMDSINGLLTLVANSPPTIATADYDGEVFVPAFAAIYGGYFVGFGAVFTRSDFSPNADVLAAKMGNMFISGMQLGWFSLGGVLSGPDYDHDCGPMGTSDLWLSATHDPEVNFLKTITSLRSHLSAYFVDGRVMVPPVLSPASPALTSPTNTHTKGPFAVVPSAFWRNDQHNTLLLVAINADSAATAAHSITTDLTAYITFKPATDKLSFTAIAPDGSVSPAIGVTVDSAGIMSAHFSLAPRSTYALEIAVVASSGSPL